MSNTPSDEEMEQLIFEIYPTYQAPGASQRILIREFARAVLAKWGKPQPVVREPLTPEQGSAMSRKHPAEDLCIWSYAMGITDAEAHHGITQKGADDGA